MSHPYWAAMAIKRKLAAQVLLIEAEQHDAAAAQCRADAEESLRLAAEDAVRAEQSGGDREAT